MSTTQPLTGPLMKSGARTVSRGEDYVKYMFNRFKVNKYAVYVDHTTVVQDLPVLSEFVNVGYYSFDINLIGKTIKDQSIELIAMDGPIPECDAWLIASTSRASAFSVSKALYKTGNEGQVICRFYGGQTTELDAYMDMFSGETETLMYVNHYFDRKYRVIFPLDVRYVVCECDGTIRCSGQRIIPPGGQIIFDSREMDLGEFHGFLRVELEVENLQVRVQPFIHFWADYINQAGMCRNHQSGWAPHPPGTVFNRGILPVEPEYEAIGSFYNANEKEIQPHVLLHYNQEGEDKSIEKTLDSIKPGHMHFENFSRLFKDVSLTGINSAYILISCDKAMHRPNHYITLKGTNQVIDTYHQTRGKARFWAEPTRHYNKEEIGLFKRFDMIPWIVSLPILEKRFNIESYMGLLPEVICDLPKATYQIYNEKGKVIHSEQVNISSADPIFLNINQYLKERNIDVEKGLFCIIPPIDAEKKISTGSGFFYGLKHMNFSHISTSFSEGKKEAHLPFYLESRFPHSREFEYSPIQISDLFAPGIVSEEYDSILIIRHQSLLRSYNHSVDYRLDVIDSRGNQYSLQKSIPPMTHQAFWLSELLIEAGIQNPDNYYTIWIKSYDGYLNSFHGTYRKSDHALTFDDASEGTLQVDPQISGIDPQKHMDKFAKFLRERGVLESIPPSWKDYLKKLKAGKQIEGWK